MAKIMKAFAAAALIVGALAAMPGVAQAQHGHGGYHGGHHGGHYHGGGWGWGPAFGLGLGLGYGWGYPYYYGGGPYYGAPYYAGGCGYYRVRVWHYNHWAIRRVWRCY